MLSSPDLDVRRKALGIALDMVSSKNVEEVVLLLKKELSKTVDEQYEKVLHIQLQPWPTLTLFLEQRVPLSSHPLNPSMRREIFRGRF